MDSYRIPGGVRNFPLIETMHYSSTEIFSAESDSLSPVTG